jgi:hypothetical protein
MTIEEWAKDFKSYVNELQMPRDDYKGIMEYIDDAIVLLEEISAFKEYFDELYGQGLEIANWHMNGSLEPFDNFYESAVMEMEKKRGKPNDINCGAEMKGETEVEID